MTISLQDWLATVQLMDQNTNAAFAITCGWQSRGNEWNHQVSFASHDLDFMNLALHVNNIVMPRSSTGLCDYQHTALAGDSAGVFSCLIQLCRTIQAMSVYPNVCSAQP
jgi:hypothetical protein